MKGFNLSSGGAGGSVTTPLGPGGLPSLSSQCSYPLPQSLSKKSSLTIASADVAIDLSGMKKSPMQRYYEVKWCAAFLCPTTALNLSSFWSMRSNSISTSRSSTTKREGLNLKLFRLKSTKIWSVKWKLLFYKSWFWVGPCQIFSPLKNEPFLAMGFPFHITLCVTIFVSCLSSSKTDRSPKTT